MAKIPGLTLTEDKVEQKIDLKELLGFSPPDEVKEIIGQAIIDKIKERTGSSKDVDGNSFKKYSDTYKDSLAFKAAGKTSKVNLRLTSDMLESLDIIKKTKDAIVIGSNDDDQNPKMYNHNKGDTVPKRQFFGVTKEELEEIKSKLKRKINEFLEDNELKKSRQLEKSLDILNNENKLDDLFKYIFKKD